MRLELEMKYEKLFINYHFDRPINAKNVNTVIKHSLNDFIKSCQKVAIYCNGGHTKMLISDFMFELKNVKYIIDNYADSSDNSGFHYIKDEEIEQNEIDGVIISSYKFKDSIIEGMKKNHPTIRYLNIYDIFAQNGINLQSDYYYHNHPYHHYHTINTIQRKISSLVEADELEEAYFSLITNYIHIKDFRTAIYYAEKLYSVVQKEGYYQLVEDLRNLYEDEIAAAANIDAQNVLMFCMDGLRRQDLSRTCMPQITRILHERGYFFENAYSFSTSTFESLVPAYSGNDDLRTAYYNQNFITEEKSPFIQEAKRQNRNICFYTDMEHFIEGEDIQYSGVFQTVTEKFWSFIMDATEEKNGLYYIHELYESHFSFSNPYTETELVSEGTAMLFDFLPQKGGRLRADYEQQHLDSLRYLDDVIAPFIQTLRCRMLVYADHGNLILKRNCKIEEIKKSKLIYDEEWIRIPYIICSPEMGKGRYNELISLMSLNDIMLSLLKKMAYEIPRNQYIKIARSELYNPDFRYLYKELRQERCLLAFEGFIFVDGYKLIIYSDGIIELLLTETDEKVEDKELRDRYLEKIIKKITVCKLENLQTE